MGALNQFDHALLGAAAAWRTPWLDGLFLATTWLGSLWLLLPVSALAGLYAYSSAGRLLAVLVVAVPMIVSGLCSLLKRLVDRERPLLHEALVSIPADAAFPSAHSAQVMAVAVAFVIVFPAAANYRIAVPLVLLVLLVGYSRIYLQVHWPSDVLAGWLVGLVSTLLILYPTLKGRLA
ncbi:MAG: phosphatase PAP2 family protein [Rhodocyclaceae bacterium]